MKNVEGWQPKSLRQLAIINYGRSPAGILADDGEYPVVGTGGTERVGNDYLYEGDSIILGRKGTIDRVYFATGRFWTIDTAYYLSGFDEALPRWLFYFLQTLDLRQMNEATGVPSLSRELLYKIEVPTPSKPEQTKIAEVLSTVDRAIAQTEALIAKQQRIKTGLMQDLLTRGIDEHGNVRSERTHTFKDSLLGRIPVEWEVEPFGSACDRVSVGIATSTTKHFRAEGVPLLRNQNVLSGQFDLTDLLFISSQFGDVNKSKRLRAGDLVTMRTGFPGRTAVVTESMSGWQTFTTLISSPKKTKYASEFMCLQMNSYVGRKQIMTLQGGGAQQNLNVGWVVNMKVLNRPWCKS
jgi:type I restriction enzyme S subunit